MVSHQISLQEKLSRARISQGSALGAAQLENSDTELEQTRGTLRIEMIFQAEKRSQT